MVSDGDGQGGSRSGPPTPAHLSELARAYLEQRAAAPHVVQPSATAGADVWRAFVRDVDSSVGAMLEPLFQADLPVERRDLDIEGVPVYETWARHLTEGAADGIMLDIHGGGLILLGGELCARMACVSALGRTMITWSPDYRMPPDHPYPAALDDCMAVYRRALDTCGPQRLVVRGASAGGNLAAAVMLRASDEGLPLPAALVLETPEVDLTESGDSFVTNAGNDTVLRSLAETNRLYAAGNELTHPYISPLFGDLEGFPPTILTTGTRDLFLSNTVRFHRKLRAAGVEAELHVGEAMPHGGFGSITPEDQELAREIERFVGQHLL